VKFSAIRLEGEGIYPRFISLIESPVAYFDLSEAKILAVRLAVMQNYRLHIPAKDEIDCPIAAGIWSQKSDYILRAHLSSI
jgi:hypothetical protein